MLKSHGRRILWGFSMKNKRIFWGLNHKTLMDAELKMLLDMGYEVYSPKKIKDDATFRSSFVNYEYDKSLSIPIKDLEKLNSFDFYYGNYTNEIISLLNKYFDVAFIILYSFEMSYYFSAYFKKELFLRAFGREGEASYEAVTQWISEHRPGKIKFLGNFLEKILRLFNILKLEYSKPENIKFHNLITHALYARNNGFIFAPSYKPIIDKELPFFADKAVYLPLSIPKSILEKKDSWIGTEKKIMFVCPSITTSNGYYENFYNKFIEYFSDLPYLVAGNQYGAKFVDQNIKDYVERNQFDEWLRTCACMFYNSQEKSQIHYHPLEAIAFGMPLIYMDGGLLEYFGGPNQPGMAKSYEEAREKIQRILNGDNDFINEIKEKQVKILDEFKYDYVRKIWEKNFTSIIKG